MGERLLCLRPFTLNFFFLMGAWDTLSTQVLLKGKEKKKEKKKIRDVNSGVLTYPDLNSRSTTYWLHKY